MTNPEQKSGILDKLGDIAAEKILPKLVELLWPRIAALFMDVILPKIVAMLPLFGAQIIEQLVEHIPGVNLVKSTEQIAEDMRVKVNAQVPDIDIPIVSDMVKDATGFDLTDFLRGFGGSHE